MDVALETEVVAIISLIIAAIAVTGGVVGLLKERVVVDKDSGQIAHIEIPGLKAKVKTNYPSVLAIMIGAILAAGVMRWFNVEFEKFPLKATVTVKHAQQETRRADVFLDVVPSRYRERGVVITGVPHDFELSVDKGPAYAVQFYTVVGVENDGGKKYVMHSGPMKRRKINGVETGVYEAELTVDEE